LRLSRIFLSIKFHLPFSPCFSRCFSFPLQRKAIHEGCCEELLRDKWSDPPPPMESFAFSGFSGVFPPNCSPLASPLTWFLDRGADHLRFLIGRFLLFSAPLTSPFFRASFSRNIQALHSPAWVGAFQVPPSFGPLPPFFLFFSPVLHGALLGSCLENPGDGGLGDLPFFNFFFSPKPCVFFSFSSLFPLSFSFQGTMPPFIKPQFPKQSPPKLPLQEEPFCCFFPLPVQIASTVMTR